MNNNTRIFALLSLQLLLAAVLVPILIAALSHPVFALEIKDGKIPDFGTNLVY